MNLQQIIDHLHLKTLTPPMDFSSVTPTGAYTSDLLSCVMAGASHGSIWITLQSHTNILAVAALLDLCAIIITEDAQPDNETIRKAQEQEITLLSTSSGNFEISGRLWELGIRSN